MDETTPDNQAFSPRPVQADETTTDTRVHSLKIVQHKILCLLGDMGVQIDSLSKTEEDKKQKLEEIVGEIKDIVVSFGEKFTGEARPIASFQKISLNELLEDELENLENSGKVDGSGRFGKVVFREFRGQKVAIKFQKVGGESDFKSEIQTLRSISHDNIIGFRGWGEHGDYVYLVMEHLDKNLQQYVDEQVADDNPGLSSRITWEIAKQIAQALFYLHNMDIPIVHGDLKPDNILVDTKPIIPKPKICDFGLSRDMQSENEPPRKNYIRYRTDYKEFKEAKEMKDFILFDVYAYGLVVLFMRTGESPYASHSTNTVVQKGKEKAEKPPKDQSELVKKIDGKYFIRETQLPTDLPSAALGDLIKRCCREKQNRPTFREIQEEFFKKGKENPYQLTQKGEFFECGFLKDTQIFVADSMVDEGVVGTQAPPGYEREDLIGEVEVENRPYNDKPKEEALRNQYLDEYRKFKKMAKEKKIDDNPAVAFTGLITERSRDDEAQGLMLKFQEKTYCHHRAMREIWRSFEPQDKKKLLPSLSTVNPQYSTSFGLHVAILTNEGPGKTRKFVFTKRSNNPGVASPGALTCGAVESCSIKDYLASDKVKELVPEADPKKAYISLINTAARGLEEELGLPLHGSDKDAITLNTIYLKFDNHEWGMCGFVDLTNEKIREENRFSFEKLNSAFTSGPKDKFEHRAIYGVDFELRTMVEWIRENHDKLASSAKIVVVKVLQGFFGVAKVAEAFSKKM